MRKDVTDSTVYEELQIWAHSQGLTADTALEVPSRLKSKRIYGGNLKCGKM